MNGGYGKIFHDWWVPRTTSLFSAPFPALTGASQSAPPDATPWPLKTSEPTAALQPIISDNAETTGTTNMDMVPSVDAHFVNGQLSSVNVGYSDGRVELHGRGIMRWRYTGASGAQSYYY